MFVYRYNGVLGMIFYEDDMPNVKPLEMNGDKGFYALEDLPKELPSFGCVTLEDFYGDYSEICDIVCEDVVNPEWDQGLVYDWVGIDYYKYDLAKRMLLTETSRYHEWTSERSDMSDEICRVVCSLEKYNYMEYNDKLKLYEYYERLSDEEPKQLTHDELVAKVMKEVQDKWHDSWNRNHGELLDEDPDEELRKMVNENIKHI